MFIKSIVAKEVRDSRGEPTIIVIIKTSKGEFRTSAPSGKSTGKYEVKPYFRSLKEDVKFINHLNIDKINYLKVQRFEDLEKFENLVIKKLGGNGLFVLEASLLKALAKENREELWEFLIENKKVRFPKPVGNAIGGGLHSKGINEKKPDFQEFLFIPEIKGFKEAIKINNLAYKISGKLLKAKKRNDEGAWETEKINEGVLNIMKRVQETIKRKYNKEVFIGIDIAASSFFNKKTYNYENLKRRLESKKQAEYIIRLFREYDLYYIEDPLNENDFFGFRKLMKEIKKTKNNKKNLIIGDDLTATNPLRLKKAIKRKSVNAIIIKPNQIGSLLKVKEVINLAKKHGIKTIISHRSGETMDNTIADLAVGWNCDFIKTGIYGKERVAKLKRIIEIEKSCLRR